MTKEEIFYNRFVKNYGGNREYQLKTHTLITEKDGVKTYYYAEFVTMVGQESIEVSKEEYECLLKGLENNDKIN